MAAQEPAILLLEDDEATRDLYRRELSRRYRVLCSDDLQEAMTILRSGTLRALVLEPAWANESGWQLMELISHLPDRQRVPIIVVTVLDQRRKALQLGAASYAVKPVLPAAVLATVDQSLGSPHPAETPAFHQEKRKKA
jgi:DNA-binding response OmpR family regulator